jgi:hypothetical protein
MFVPHMDWSREAFFVGTDGVGLFILEGITGVTVTELASNLPMPAGSQKGDIVMTYCCGDLTTDVAWTETTIIRNGNTISSTTTPYKPYSSDMIWK